MIRMPVNCRALVAQMILIITVMISNNNKTGTDESPMHFFLFPITVSKIY
jgi:hypothetical protein